MVSIIPLLFAAVIGFTHAFEVDHLVAVSSIVTRRNNVRDAIKDGIYWGLGHTSTILLVGILMIIMRLMITEDTFGYLEAGVGFMLIALGIHRMLKDRVHLHHHGAHSHQHSHRLAYGVGLVHGLAGSGALVLLVMTQIKSSWESIAYLLIFGIGSIAGMLLASGVLSLPFSRSISMSRRVQYGLTLLSSLLCIGLGAKIVYEHLLV